MGDRIRLPVLPLRETVVFPGVAVPISAGRPGTVEAIQSALDGDRRMFAVCQRENADDATPEILYDFGVIVRLVQAQRVRGGLQLLIQGEQRAQALEISQARARWPWRRWSRWWRSSRSGTRTTRRTRRWTGSSGSGRWSWAGAVESRRRRYSSWRRVSRSRAASPTWSPSTWTSTAGEAGAAGDAAGGEPDAAGPALRGAGPGPLEAQQEIQQRVQEELGEKQREMVLREQLKAIQKELGEGGRGDGGGGAAREARRAGPAGGGTPGGGP
jgi:ATP-dependent Lon protease